MSAPANPRTATAVRNAVYLLPERCPCLWLVGVSAREYRELEAGEHYPRLRDVGPDLQAVRVAADVRWSGRAEPSIG
jgi:hypothetical protein